MSSVKTTTYARTHTAAFVSDKMRNLLKRLVYHGGLDPQQLLDAWSAWADRAVRTWLETGDLVAIVVEFYQPGSAVAAARWDFPIRYDGNGVDQMWVDREFFEESFPKAEPPPKGCSYRIALLTKNGCPDVPGVGDTTLRSTNGLVAREAGTVVATPDIMATARYYRK